MPFPRGFRFDWPPELVSASRARAQPEGFSESTPSLPLRARAPKASQTSKREVQARNSADALPQRPLQPPSHDQSQRNSRKGTLSAPGRWIPFGLESRAPGIWVAPLQHLFRRGRHQTKPRVHAGPTSSRRTRQGLDCGQVSNRRPSVRECEARKSDPARFRSRGSRYRQ